ncbi:MAG: hypothetical protein R2788_16955 [Saprospiraceae bacterium]
MKALIRRGEAKAGCCSWAPDSRPFYGYAFMKQGLVKKAAGEEDIQRPLIYWKKQNLTRYMPGDLF